MFRTNQSSGSTKLLRRSKHLKNSSYEKGRIMLTDLCPEEKAKIGELIKTLEVRKVQNLELTNEINELRNKFEQQNLQLINLRQTITKYEQKEQQLQQLIDLHHQQQSKQKSENLQMKQLIRNLQQHQEKKAIKIDQYCMTETPIFHNQSCQVQAKKKKQKNIESQTDFIEDRRNALQRPNNSKSFDKIMRKRQLEDSVHRRKEKFKKQKTESEEQQQEFEELAQKWLELKERNLSKIKTSGKKPFEECPRQFKEQEMYEYNDSFGPHKQSSEDEENQPQFDEIQLNKILKSKNFRASRVLNQQSSNRHFSEESGRKKSIEVKPKMKMSSHSRPIDFYETDLLNLVSSINQPN